MGFVNAKCVNCGAAIKIDDNKATGFCSHCGSSYVKEDVINNYNIHMTTVNEYSTTQNIVKNIYGSEKKESEEYVLSAETWLKLGDYAKAAEAYDKAIECNPAEYKAWLGKARMAMNAIPQNVLNGGQTAEFFECEAVVKQHLKKAFKVAPPDAHPVIQSVADELARMRQVTEANRAEIDERRRRKQEEHEKRKQEERERKRAEEERLAPIRAAAERKERRISRRKDAVVGFFTLLLGLVGIALAVAAAGILLYVTVLSFKLGYDGKYIFGLGRSAARWTAAGIAVLLAALSMGVFFLLGNIDRNDRLETWLKGCIIVILIIAGVVLVGMLITGFFSIDDCIAKRT